MLSPKGLGFYGASAIPVCGVELLENGLHFAGSAWCYFSVYAVRSFMITGVHARFRTIVKVAYILKILYISR
jgi:hypothetical protein